MLTYSRDMEAAKEASTDDRIILLVPTGDPDSPISQEIGQWDSDQERFEGEWRHIDVPVGDPLAGFPAADPIAWCRIPPIPADLFDLAVKKAA